MTEIRRIDTTTNEEILRMSEYAFQYRLSEKEFQLKKKETESHCVFGSYEDGHLAAKVHTIPLEVFIQGKIFKMGGVAGVATWPEFRRKGHVKELLRKSLEEMKKQGQVISFLHPFSIPFYRKYGWELIFEQKISRIPVTDLKKKWDIKGKMRRLPFDDSTISSIQSVYEAYASNFNGPLKRTHSWWKHRVWKEDLVLAVGYTERGQEDSYMIYKVKDRIMEVKDYAYSTMEGLQRLLEFMSNHDSMAEYVQITVPVNDRMHLLFHNRHLEQKIKAYFMGRIVDTEKFMQAYPYSQAQEFQPFVIEVEDSFMSSNSGNYFISKQEGRIRVKKINDHDYPMVRCSIQQLSAIMLSYQRANELAALQLISGDGIAIEQLDRLVEEKQTYIPDFF